MIRMIQNQIIFRKSLQKGSLGELKTVNWSYLQLQPLTRMKTNSKMMLELSQKVITKQYLTDYIQAGYDLLWRQHKQGVKILILLLYTINDNVHNDVILHESVIEYVDIYRESYVFPAVRGLSSSEIVHSLFVKVFGLSK